MSVLFPLGMAALAALVPLIVLYILKQKRVEVPVPAAFLWQNALEDLRASSLFQRLRTPLLLLLQALAIVLFALAAAGASLNLDIGDDPRRVILLVDRSGSMQAFDENGKTRFEAARELALDAVSGLSGADEMMVIGFDRNAEVLSAFTGDESTLAPLIEGLRPRDLPSRPQEALRLAASFAKASPGFEPEVIVISDGAVEGKLPVLGCQVTYARVGSSANNAGIAEAKLTQMPGERPQLFVRAENASDEVTIRSVVLRRDGRIIDAREIEIEPRGDAAAFFELEEPETTDLVLLEVVLDGEDVLPADDRVRLVLRPTVPRFGLLVRDGPTIYLDPRKLEALHPGLAMVEVTSAEAATTLAGDQAVDLIVYDSVSPETTPDVPAQLYINTLPPEGGLSDAGVVEFPIVIDWDRTHPITTRCQFDDLLITSAMKLAGFERSRLLIETTDGPLVLLTPIPGREVVVVAFDPSASNLPLKLAWPLMLANGLDYLLSGVERDGETPVQRTGSPIVAEGVGPLTVRTPDGEETTIEPAHDGRAVFTDTVRSGLYEVSTGAAPDPDPRAFAMLDSAEIAIEPRPELVLGGDRVEASPANLQRNVLLRDPLLLLALGLLLLEWGVWCGRR